MFDLDREVNAWAHSVHPDRCRNAASVAELVDHLHCEIDRARAEGLADEAAFQAAVAKIGEIPELAAEHTKNRSLFAVVCAAAARYELRVSNPRHRRLLLAHAILWASLMIGTALILSDSTAPETFSLLLILVLLPVWWGSDQLLRRALRGMK